MAMQKAFNTAKSIGLGIAESVTPVLKESKFRDTGVITPEEFVMAGDHLVLHCPTWNWSAGETSKRKPYLPLGMCLLFIESCFLAKVGSGTINLDLFLCLDKQFLMTKNVPCFKRCKQIMSDVASGTTDHMIKLSEDDEEGWVDTHHGIQDEQATVAIMSMGTDESETVTKG